LQARSKVLRWLKELSFLGIVDVLLGEVADAGAYLEYTAPQSRAEWLKNPALIAGDLR